MSWSNLPTDDYGGLGVLDRLGDEKIESLWMKRLEIERKACWNFPGSNFSRFFRADLKG